ncbi:MAG: bacillithiol biosynthesis deacetylase BshB1 [Hymenobacter sp.]|nr:MAG: bacillithiol biosynthesis deacetylase BshB1 [Hymenobacter sp.]
MKVDILALGAHPDDVEMSCSGTLLAAVAAGKKIAIVDFTRGELGTRGTPEIRAAESAIVLCNAVNDRHPDHGRGSQLATEACFLSGLRMIETLGHNGQPQAAWRPKYVYHYIQDRQIPADFVVDITPYWAGKWASINAYGTQFFNTNADPAAPQTYLSGQTFSHFMEARAREFGHLIGVEFGEGFTVERTLGVKELGDLI